MSDDMNESLVPVDDLGLVTEPAGKSGMLIDVSSLKNGLEQRAKMLTAFREWMGKLLVSGRDYAVIPGTQKPSLLKPGAETLALAAGARFVITDESRKELPNGHLEVLFQVRLEQRNGEILGDGIGSCSTMESRYRFRKASRRCPACGAEAIIKGKAEYGGGWVCFQKKGGCKAKFNDGDEAIESQVEGQVENENPADQRNTVAKMAKKRAMVDVTLTAFGLSDFFTQDIEEFTSYEQEPKDDDKPKFNKPAYTQKPPSPAPSSEWKPQGPLYDALWKAGKDYVLESEGLASASNPSKVQAALKAMVSTVLGKTKMDSDADMESVRKVFVQKSEALRGGHPPTNIDPNDLPF